MDIRDDSPIPDKTDQKVVDLQNLQQILIQRMSNLNDPKNPTDMHYEAEEVVIYPLMITKTLGTSLSQRGTDVERNIKQLRLINVATI